MGLLSILAAGAFILGAPRALSLERVHASLDDPRENGPSAEEELHRPAPLGLAHHDAFARAIPVRRKRNVKPSILSEFIWRTDIDTGSPSPDLSDIVEWTYRHPQETEHVFYRPA